MDESDNVEDLQQLARKNWKHRAPASWNHRREYGILNDGEGFGRYAAWNGSN